MHILSRLTAFIAAIAFASLQLFGEDNLRVTASFTADGIVIQVQDAAGGAVSDAAVSVRGDQMQAPAVAFTDEAGHAVVAGTTWPTNVQIIVTRGRERGITTLQKPAQPGRIEVKPEVKIETPARLPQPEAVPTVTVIHGPTNEHISSGSSHKKWLWIALAVAGAGAGAGVAVMGKGSASTSTSTTNGVVIGTPTISVGAPH